MQKLTITAIGIPKQRMGTKRPFETNYIKAKEFNNEFLNFFVNKTTSQWKVGQKVEVESVETREYTAKDGSLKTSYDIKLPRFGGNSDVMKALEEVRGQNAKMLLMLTQIGQHLMPPKPDNYPTRESEGITEMPFEDDGLDQINEGNM